MTIDVPNKIITLPSTNPLNNSLIELQSQIKQMTTSLQTLVQNNTFGNAVATLNIIKKRIVKARDATINSTVYYNSSFFFNNCTINISIPILQLNVNETITNMLKTIKAIEDAIFRIPGSARNCSMNITQGVFELMFNYTTNMSSCPVDQANIGLKMVNDALNYVSYLTNLTTAIPIVVDMCYSRNDTKACLVDFIADSTKAIAEAPGKIAYMTLKAKLFIDTFSIFMALCFVDVSFAAQVQSMQYGIDVNACFAKSVLG